MPVNMGPDALNFGFAGLHAQNSMMKTTNTWEDSVFGTESQAHETSTISGLMRNTTKNLNYAHNTSTTSRGVFGKARRHTIDNINDNSVEYFKLQDLQPTR